MKRNRSDKQDSALEATFVELLSRHQGILSKVVRTYSYETEDRKDLEQDICLQLWKAYPSYDPSRPFTTWMYRIALNVAISNLRKAKGTDCQLLSLDDQVTVRSGHRTVADDHRMILEQILRGLGELDRALMVLYLDDLSYREISEVLGISETNVATKINRLKQQIRSQVSDKD